MLSSSFYAAVKISCQSGVKDSDWLSSLLLLVSSSNWLPDVHTYGDNLQSAICPVRAVCHRVPPSLQHVAAVTPPLKSGCGVPSIRKAAISDARPGRQAASERMRPLLRSGPDRWPLHTSFRTSLNLSLRAAAGLHESCMRAAAELQHPTERSDAATQRCGCLAQPG